LYHDIDNLELYVGLQAEEAKAPMPGAGLCPGFTISRAILADAVSLTRGDRFLTVDLTRECQLTHSCPAAQPFPSLTAYNLTNWGYQDLRTKDNDGSYGGMLSKLLFRHLGDYYPAGSAYAHFPFMVPRTMKQYVAKLPVVDTVKKYTWTRPVLPAGPVVTVKDAVDAQRILSNPETFTDNVSKKVTFLVGGILVDTNAVGLLTSDTAFLLFVHKSTQVKTVLLDNPEVRKSISFMTELTHTLASTKSTLTPSGVIYLDIVKDVISLLPVYWLSDEIVRATLYHCRTILILGPNSVIDRPSKKIKTKPSWYL